MERPRVMLGGPGAADLAAELRADGRFLLLSHSDETGEAVRAVERWRPDILVLRAPGDAEGPESLLAALEEAARSAPYVTLVVAGLTPRLAGAIALMEAGAHGLLPGRLRQGELADYLARLHMKVAARKRYWSEHGLPLLHPRRPQVVAVFSPKGGVGKTTVAANLALALQTITGQPTLLLDMDVAAGDVSVLLDLKPERTLVDYTRALAMDEDAALSPYLTDHRSGLRLLAAPASPDGAELIRPPHIKRAMAMAKQEADHVIVDTAPAFSDQVLAVLDSADAILMLLTPDIAALKNVRTALGVMEGLQYPTDRIRIVINRAESESGLSRGEVEEVLGTPVLAAIPNDPHLVTTATNRGQPFVTFRPDAAASSAVMDLARALAGEEAPVANRPPLPLWRRLLGRR